MATLEGDFSTPPGRFAVLAARFNSFVVDRLVEGAVEGLTRHGVAAGDIDTVRVPGSFELPGAARRLARSGYAAVVCLGAVIRGATDHYDHVASAATSGLASLAAGAEIPIIFGVLTCDTLEQAIDRAGAKAGNKGFEAAVSAVEMVNLYRAIDRHTRDS